MAGPATYAVNVDKFSLDFPGQPDMQTHDGLAVKIDVSKSVPQLYYRYQVSSKVTGDGSYLAVLSNPPTVYLVYRIPFYKNTPDMVVLKVELTNNSSQILDTSHAVCAFDLDGQTVLTQPLKTGDLLPGHVLAVPVVGPSLSQLKGHKELVVWIYQLGLTNSATPFKWALPYTLTITSTQGEATLVDQAPVESRVSHYEGMIEPANSDIEAAAPPSGP